MEKMKYQSVLPGTLSLTLGFAGMLADIAPLYAKDIEEKRSSQQQGLNQSDELPALDGSNNNLSEPTQGVAGTPYIRLGAANYADNLSEPVDAPNARYISNRIFADKAQNLFSENGVTQWAWTWGQFIDHTVGLRDIGSELLSTPFDADDPLEHFSNSSTSLRDTRSAPVEGTGVDSPRQQLNVNSSYIDAWAVYGGTEERLEWLREGPLDNDLSNNGAKLLLTPNNYLPRASERGDASSSPTMEIVGHLRGASDADDRQVVTGDTRANENIALTAVQTLFAREHNRIVDALPAHWSEQRRFDAARLLVIATQQYITYNEFLPSVGIKLDQARGYQKNVDASISNEFATVGYRAHSMIHGEIEMETEATRYDNAEIALFRSFGLEVDQSDDHVEIAVPLNIAFGNPQLVTSIGLGPILQGLAAEPQYRNDEQIDNQLRSVLFQLVKEGVLDPDECLDGPTLNECFAMVADLGTLDIIRGRDHGIPTYNDLREVYGLPRISSFSELTGESSEEFPIDDKFVDTGAPLDDPDILDHVALFDVTGQPIELGTEEADGEAVSSVRRTTLAARLKGVYGSDVNQIDAFVGMVSEPHIAGTEFGELQYAMWKTQFQALRDGDRYHYAWSQPLRSLERQLLQSESNSNSRRNEKSLGRNDLGELNWQRTLAQVIADNTDISSEQLPENMFLAD